MTNQEQFLYDVAMQGKSIQHTRLLFLAANPNPPTINLWKNYDSSEKRLNSFRSKIIEKLLEISYLPIMDEFDTEIGEGLVGDTVHSEYSFYDVQLAEFLYWLPKKGEEEEDGEKEDHYHSISDASAYEAAQAFELVLNDVTFSKLIPENFFENYLE